MYFTYQGAALWKCLNLSKSSKAMFGALRKPRRTGLGAVTAELVGPATSDERLEHLRPQDPQSDYGIIQRPPKFMNGSETSIFSIRNIYKQGPKEIHCATF
ncbi:hypothetical protein GCM10027180_36260 [Microbulbifer echini]